MLQRDFYVDPCNNIIDLYCCHSSHSTCTLTLLFLWVHVISLRLHCDFPLGWDCVLYPLESPYYSEKYLEHSRLSKKCSWLVNRSDSVNKVNFSLECSSGYGYTCSLFSCYAKCLFLTCSWETFRLYFSSLEWKVNSSTTEKHIKWTLIQGMEMQAFPTSPLLGLKKSQAVVLDILPLSVSSCPVAHAYSLAACIIISPRRQVKW